MWFVAIGLLAAMGIGYLVKHSLVLRSFLGLPDDSNIDTELNTTQTAPISSAAEGQKTLSRANAATQTSVETDAPSASPSLNLSTDAVKLSSSAAVADRRPQQTEEPSIGSTSSSRAAAALEKKAAVATEATRMLQRQVDRMAGEAERYKQVIAKMEMESNQLRDRLAEQASVQLTKGPSRFENLSLGENRPSKLIKRYADLYTDDRIEAWDDLDLLPDVIDDNNKEKLLFSIVVLCFHQARRSLDGRQRAVRTILLPSLDGSAIGSLDVEEDGVVQLDALVKDIDDCVESYLRRTVSRYDILDDFKEVTSQLWSQLADYPSLRDCHSLVRYIEECQRIAWALTIQNPAYVIDHDVNVFSEDRHTRFHTSDPDSTRIESFLWPALIEEPSGHCAAKAVVVTRDA